MSEKEANQIELQKKLDEANALLKKQESILELSTVQKKYYDSLNNDKEKDSFLAKSANEREKLVKKDMGDDEKFTYGDQVIRKSEVGASTYLVLKQTVEEKQELAKKLEREIVKREVSEYVTKAASEYPNVPGKDIQKGVVLRYVDKNIQDEDVKKSILDIMKYANECGSRILEENTKGVVFDPNSEDDPNAKLEKMASDYAEKHEVSFADAYLHITQHDKNGQKLFAKAIN